MNVSLVVVFIVFFITIITSVIVNIIYSKWKCDIQTYDGFKKLNKIAYDKLELERVRVLKKSIKNKYEIIIPINAPIKSSSRPIANKNWQFITSVSAIFSTRSDFAKELKQDIYGIKLDELRLYGIKNGKKYLSYTYDFYPQNYEDIKKRVDNYNNQKKLTSI